MSYPSQIITHITQQLYLHETTLFVHLIKDNALNFVHDKSEISRMATPNQMIAELRHK